MPYNDIDAIRPSHPTGQAVYADALTAWRKMARVVETRAELSSEDVPSTVDAIFTLGRTTAGDGLQAIYKREVSEPVSGEKIQSNDGTWWSEVVESHVTDLSNTPGATTVEIESSTGANTTFPAATTSLAGAMTGADKTKLDAIDKADASEIRAGTADKYITADNAETASEEVTLTDAATVAVDWSTFINGAVTLAGNRTLGAPSNGEPGTWRFIRVIQDGTGSRTLAFNAVYKFAGGTAPTMSTGASEVDTLSIYCVTTSIFYVFSALDMS